jgi:ubiquitin-protein ligase
MAPSTALRRLMTEYKELTINPPEGIQAGPVSEDNFFEWEALILGPEVTINLTRKHHLRMEYLQQL